MKLLQPSPPPYDPLVWVKRPLHERGRLVCEAWATQGYGTPFGAYAIHAFKVALYIGAWLFFCSFTPGLGRLSTISSWWLSPIAFQKAILWSMLFEGLGLGCGSGPLTGRYFPPFGGFLYFLRPGTTKLPLFPAAPLLGGIRRTWVDVGLYLASKSRNPVLDPLPRTGGAQHLLSKLFQELGVAGIAAHRQADGMNVSLLQFEEGQSN